MPWEETENEIRHRVRDPDDFQPDSFRTITLKEDKPRVFAIIGKLKGETKTTIQALCFPKEDGWTLEKAKDWVAEHFRDSERGKMAAGLAAVERLALAPAAAIAPTSVDRASRRFIARALSGQPIRRYESALGGDVLLVFEPDGADLSRFNAGVAPLLDGHRSDAGIAAQLGVVRRGWFQGRALMVECELSRRPEIEPILEDLAAGVLRGVSLGVEILESRIERNNDGPPRRIIAKWMPYEVSLVSVPADAGALVLCMTEGMEVNTQEQNRAETFDARAFAVKLAAQFKLDNDFITRASTAKSEAEVRAAAFDELVRRYEQHPTHSHVEFLSDETERQREGMVLALMHRAHGVQPPEIARPYLHMSLSDLARERLRARGCHVTVYSPAEIVRLAMSTSDFPGLLGDFAQKSLLAAYQPMEPAIKRVCRISTARDFKPKRVLRVGEGSALVETPEGATYRYGSIGEWKASYSLKTYGGLFMLTRQAIINDDLSAFAQFVHNLALLAADFEAKLIVSLLTANSGAGPVLDDGYNLFHASAHKNTVASGGAISVETLGVARALMRTQKGVDGQVVIDADPRFLVTPAALETVAQQVTTAITPHAADEVNPFAGRLIAIAEPRLDSVSQTAWYLFADPQRVPTLEFGYLEGAQGPQVESEWSFEMDAIRYKLRLDCGVGAVDYRGAFMNAGA